MYLSDKELTITSAPRTGEHHEFAEAIRRGCKIAPIQCFGHYTEGKGTACAIQAGVEAGGSYRALCVPCPQCGSTEMDTIPHLNDSHRWTRERIADWLDTL